MTVVFFAVVLALVAFQLEVGDASGAVVKPTFVVLGFVPVVFYFVATGRLKQFSGAGFEVVLRREADRALGDVGGEEIEVATDDVAADRIVDLHRADERARPTVLEFQTGREDACKQSTVEEYLDTLADSLEYVLFTDDRRRFEGYMDFAAFEPLFEDAGAAVIDEIETGEILARPGVNSGAVSQDSSHRATLQEMDRQQVDELAVLDSNERFVGVVTQDELVRKLLAEAIREV